MNRKNEPLTLREYQDRETARMRCNPKLMEKATEFYAACKMLYRFSGKTNDEIFQILYNEYLEKLKEWEVEKKKQEYHWLDLGWISAWLKGKIWRELTVPRYPPPPPPPPDLQG